MGWYCDSQTCLILPCRNCRRMPAWQSSLWGFRVSELVAYHEAGHVLLAVLLGARIRSVTIEPDRDDGPERYGDTQILWPRGRWSAREQAEKDVQVALAGPVAEMIHSGDPFHPGFVAEWAADWQAAWMAA